MMTRARTKPVLDTVIITESAAETAVLGERLGRLLQPGDVVALVGDLGAGKTCLAQGIARGLGVSGFLTSPTFILINQYPLPDGTALHHVDAYRLDDPIVEGRALGLEELLRDDGICLVEWADRIDSLLPAEYIRVELEHAGENRRRIRLAAYGEHYAGLLKGNELTKVS
jgi:tRNA threonylcarbamoyladenosine biosynthesis protein TsaE